MGAALMAVTDIPVLDLIKNKLKWHEARQRVLAENIANADMPGFKPRDLEPMQSRGSQRTAPPVHLSVTHTAHIVGQGLVAGGGGAAAKQAPSWETTPDGNAVVLEEQMMKLTENQMDHQAASTLYGRGMALLRTAIRSG